MERIVTKSEEIKERLKKRGIRYFACDNIAPVLEDGDKEELIVELTDAFQVVLDKLIIDTENDPNSRGTAKRMAKMYVRELFNGRYTKPPEITSFPNEDDDYFGGMLVTKANIISMCSHHHQAVRGTAYIGLIPTNKVIGLSKYTRIAQWLARRGQLQESLTNQIANEIKKHTGTENVAVYVEATHGCMECRGVLAEDSLTQTSVVHGLFHNNSVKEEFMSHIRLSKRST